MKITGIKQTTAAIELEVTPKQLIEALRAEAFRQYEEYLTKNRLKPADFGGRVYDQFYMKDGDLRGYKEEGRHPRNQEWDHVMPDNAVATHMIATIAALDLLDKNLK